MSLPGMLPHTATVEPYEGGGAYGDVYGAPFEVPCYFEGQRQLVRDSDGSEAVSEGTMYTDLRDDITPGSRVAVAGRTTWVLSVSRLDDDGTLSHLEVALA